MSIFLFFSKVIPIRVKDPELKIFCKTYMKLYWHIGFDWAFMILTQSEWMLLQSGTYEWKLNKPVHFLRTQEQKDHFTRCCELYLKIHFEYYKKVFQNALKLHFLVASFWILSFELQDMCTLWISSNGFWRFPKTWGDFFFKYIDRFEIFMDYSHWSLLKLVVFCCDISWFNSLYWIYSVCHSGTFDTNSFHFVIKIPPGVNAVVKLSDCLSKGRIAPLPDESNLYLQKMD